MIAKLTSHNVTKKGACSTAGIVLASWSFGAWARPFSMRAKSNSNKKRIADIVILVVGNRLTQKGLSLITGVKYEQ